MSDPILAKYDFLPWVRRGIVASLTNVDPLSGKLPRRGTLPVKLTVQASLGSSQLPAKQAGAPIELYGPGDVIGIDPRHVIRTEPRHLTANFEPNYFAGIEFDHPDFPWLFTPAAPNKDRLRPWLNLIVLAPDEFEESQQAPHPLPSINVKELQALPNLSESWTWAHTQVSGGNIQDLSSHPAIAFSRLLCPRRLLPDTLYTAFLVPAFDLGVLAGLGQNVAGGNNVEVKPAWGDQTPTPLTLPVYYRFEFHTSQQGDFESLVRQLKAVHLPKEVGLRPIDVDHVGWGSMPGAGGPINMGGALRSTEPFTDDWKDPGKSTFQNSLMGLLNKPAAGIDDPQNPVKDDPVVEPPLYGRWHAAVQQITATSPAWLNQLNLDPRFRSAAGIGTQVVHEELTQLMASAWNQLGSIEQANQKLRQAQMARSALLQLHVQHFQAAPTEALLSLTTMVHSRIQASPITVRATIAQSRLPQRALSAPFRSIAAPRRQIRQRQLAAQPIIEEVSMAVVAAAPGILSRLNTGDIAPVPPLHAPGGMVSLDEVSSGMGFGLLRPPTFQDIPPHPEFLILPPGQSRPPTSVPSVLARATVVDSPEAQAFRQAAIDATTVMQAPNPDPATPPPADLTHLHGTILDRLHPNTTVPRRVNALVSILVPTVVSTIIQRGTDDPLDTIMAAPEFPQPMYEPVRDLSQDYLLPGVNKVDPNTVGLLVADHAFIEAYLAGLNNEMARQLLWNDYPTDQRGSYFRQFWDVRSYVPSPQELQNETPDEIREKLKDIPPIHKWPPGNNLGSNENRADVVPNNLVLLVRGELLRRYPNTVVYACEAKWDMAHQKHVLGDQEKHILFRGTLSPDLTFFGFNLTIDDARGTPDGSQPGWFFVFQQPPSEPRFGLEPVPDPYKVQEVTEWNVLSWSNLTQAAADLDKLRFASPNTPLQKVHITPGTQDAKNAWDINAAQMAYITFRRPVRVAIHAETMLPKATIPGQ